MMIYGYLCFLGVGTSTTPLAGPEADRRWTREELAQSRLAGSWLLAVEGFVYDVGLFATWMNNFWGGTFMHFHCGGR